MEVDADHVTHEEYPVVTRLLHDISTFHRFSKLPLELRFAIWKMTVEPREVKVRIVKPISEDSNEVMWSHPNQWHYIDSTRCNKAMNDAGVPSSTRKGRRTRREALRDWKPYRPYVHMVSSTIPAALHTCREARNHGLYQQVSLHPDEQHTDRRYVWLNLDIDLLNIGTSYLVHFETIAPAIKLLNFSRENTDEWWFEYEKDLLPIFAGIQELRVVCIDGF